MGSYDSSHAAVRADADRRGASPSSDPAPVAPSGAQTLARRLKRRFRSNAVATLLIGPAIVLVALVSIYPIFDAITLSLYSTNYAEKVKFIGLTNYIDLARDPAIWNAARNSFIYTFGSLAVALPVSLGIALLLNQPSRMQGALRTIAILPWVISQTIAALLWGWLLNADFGPGTHALQELTGIRVAVLAAPALAMIAVIAVNVWSSYPQATLLLLAALQTVPRDLHEAARIDGAGPVVAFRHVTLPLIRSTLLVVVIQLTLLYFNMVTLIYVFTGGGPLASTETLALRVLKTSFEDWNIGRGAALGLVITLINLAFSLLYMRTLRSQHK